MAGEMLKSASALGVPMTGVGLLYRETSHQWLDHDRRQQESWETLNPADLPITRVRDHHGLPIHVDVPLAGETVACGVWSVLIGRVRLLLLDTDVQTNTADQRGITRRLYGGNLEHRLRQELVLGIGGMKALRAVGCEPKVLHCNEGHSAFGILERIRGAMVENGCDFEAARRLVAATTVFTTHTPVAAGHDYFPPELARRYLQPIAAGMQCEVEDLMALGRYTPEDESDTFCPTVLALRTAGMRNGVSRLHGSVTRTQWRGLWPRVPESEIPIGHVTNGVHYQSWLSPECSEILNHAFGPDWRTTPLDAEMWRGFLRVNDHELWDARNRARTRLVEYARAWLTLQRARRSAFDSGEVDPSTCLDPDALTLGFVGRFVAYKRPTLFLQDRERLTRILGDADRPVQLVFAGKAHPRDHAGKDLLRDVVSFARDSGLRHRVVFLEDFDMAMDRYLVQGVDLWLNTPMRPLEACGISGMKAGANGALNFSTIDGWWDEAWNARDHAAAPIGWSIGDEAEHEDPDEHARIDAMSFYDELEYRIVPDFYDRDVNGLPTRWLSSVKQSIATLSPTWNSHRMVQEYTDDWYVAGAPRSEALSARNARKAKKLSERLARLREQWEELHIAFVQVARNETGGTVRAALRLGALKPSDVLVQVWLHPEGAAPYALDPPMHLKRRMDGLSRFTVTVPQIDERATTVAVRVLPQTEDLMSPFDTGLILWSEGVHIAPASMNS